MAGYAGLDITVQGSHLYGEILYPDGSYDQPRPCVIFFHGFPGTGRNDDLLFSLRRAGCVCVNVHHRGAWGSEGKYLVSNCVEDAVTIARYARRWWPKKYHIDPEKIFLAGHSMGGNTCVNAARKCPWLKGIILLAPFNSALASPANLKFMKALMQEGLIMHTDGAEVMLRDIYDHAEEYAYQSAVHDLKDMNICCVTGKSDPLIHYETDVRPLFDGLKKEGSQALLMHKSVPGTHGLDSSRIAMIRYVASFIEKLCA